jgi:hypothetical protein
LRDLYLSDLRIQNLLQKYQNQLFSEIYCKKPTPTLRDGIIIFMEKITKGTKKELEDIFVVKIDKRGQF